MSDRNLQTDSGGERSDREGNVAYKEHCTLIYTLTSSELVDRLETTEAAERRRFDLCSLQIRKPLRFDFRAIYSSICNSICSWIYTVLLLKMSVDRSSVEHSVVSWLRIN